MALGLTEAPKRQAASLTRGDAHGNTRQSLTARRLSFCTLISIFPQHYLPWSFCEKTENRGDSTTIHRKNFKQLASSCLQKFFETKLRQIMVFDTGGCSGSLCGCLLQRGRCALLRGKVRLGRRDENRGRSVFCRMEDCIILFQEGLEGVLWKDNDKERTHQGWC